MRRIMSVLVLLTLLLGATGLFAASADWKGYFITEFRSISTKLDDADQAAALAAYTDYTSVKDYTTTYFWQKLELYPSWKLSDNVTLNAGFYSQFYWGNGRLYGFETTKPIAQDTGSFKGNGSEINTVYLSSAWAVLSFMDGSLTVDVGRRKNPEWGTGVFFGSTFTPDRIFLTYRFSAFGGMNIPYFIFEDRNNFKITSASYYTNNTGTKVTGASDDSLRQLLFGWIYVAPGKTLVGITINPNFVRKNWTSADGSTVNGEATTFWAADLYADHKFVFGDLSVKPIFEVVYGTGKVFSKASKIGAFTGPIDFYADVLNFIIKVDVSMKNVATITPEFGYVKAPKKAEAGKFYSNFWGVNQFCPGQYTVGNIFEALNGGTSSQSAAGNFEYPARFYVKVEATADILDQYLKGLNVYVRFIMAQDLGYKKYNGSDMINDSVLNAYLMGYAPARPYDKKVVTEFDAGLSYKIDSYTTFGIDFGYAKWGKSYQNDTRVQGVIGSGHTSTSGVDKRGATEIYLGSDLKIKF